MGKTWAGILAQRERNDALTWGGGGWEASRADVEEAAGQKEPGGWSRGLAEDVYKSECHQPRDDVYIHGNALDHSRSSAVRKKRRGPRTRSWETQCLVAGRGEAVARDTGGARTERDVTATHRVKGIEGFSVVPGTE